MFSPVACDGDGVARDAAKQQPSSIDLGKDPACYSSTTGLTVTGVGFCSAERLSKSVLSRAEAKLRAPVIRAEWVASEQLVVMPNAVPSRTVKINQRAGKLPSGAQRPA